MQYLKAIEKPKKLYAMLYGTEMPRNVETFIAMYCKAYDCNPDDAAMTRHILDAHLVHRLETLPASFNEEMSEVYDGIKDDIINIAKISAQQQYDNYIREFKQGAKEVLEDVARAANRKAPDRYKLMTTMAYTVLMAVVVTALLAMRYGFRELHIAGAMALIAVMSFVGGMYAKE